MYNYINVCICITIIHRIDSSYLVKVADFGMSRDVYEWDYYRQDSMHAPLPVKWMTLESMEESIDNCKSDVVCCC